MSKYCYLIGAGASAEAIPTVENFYPKAIEWLELAKQDSSLRSTPGRRLSVQQLSAKDAWFKSCKQVIEKIKYFKTPDTLAKFLWQTKGDHGEVVRFISAYFMFLYRVWQKIDNRNLAFMTSIIRKNHKIHPDISILTYNYDLMLLDYYFQKVEILKDLATILSEAEVNVFPIHPYDNTKLREIDIVYLNGIAALYKENNSPFIPRSNNGYEIFEYVFNQKHDQNPIMDFGWDEENSDYKNQVKTIIMEKVQNCETLIIVGYSFPFFNRTLDNVIVQKFCQNDIYSYRQKIIIQDPNDFSTDFRKRFNIAKDTEIIHYNNTSSFYIPNEL